MILLWSNCTQPDVGPDGLYVLLSVTTATLSFFLNLLQLLVIVHQNLLRLHKNLVVLHLCLCGQLSSASVLCSLLLAAAPPSPAPLAAVLHLLTLFTFAPLITLLVLQQHPLAARLSRPRALGLLLLLAWCQALVISLVPLTGWYGDHPLPPASFAALVCVLYFLHYPLVLILMVDLCMRKSNKVGVALDVESFGLPLRILSGPGRHSPTEQTTRCPLAPKRSPGVEPLKVNYFPNSLEWSPSMKAPRHCLREEHDLMSALEVGTVKHSQKQVCGPVGESRRPGTLPHKWSSVVGGESSSPAVGPFRMRNEVLLVCLWSACTLPFFCHTAVMAAATQDFCEALAANERAALWTSWMTMLFAAVRPIFHAQLEDDLGDGTVCFINAMCRIRQ